MTMAGADPFTIMKALGNSDLQMTMHYVSLGKSHIREQVEKLNAIRVPPNIAAQCRFNNPETVPKPDRNLVLLLDVPRSARIFSTK